MLLAKKNDVNLKIKNHNDIDIDSISIFLKIEALVPLIGWRASLASSTEFIRDKDLVGQYCNIFDGQFIVKVPFEQKLIIQNKMFEKGIQYEACWGDEERIAKQKVWVSVPTIYSILREINLKFVRVIAHGLKELHFKSFDWDEFLIVDSTNRFDFAFVKKT